MVGMRANLLPRLRERRRMRRLPDALPGPGPPRCANQPRENVSRVTHSEHTMRAIRTLICVVSFAAPAGAQGWIMPRGCVGLPGINPAAPAPRFCAASIERTRSDVRVELVGRVLHYEVDERFVNRGGGLGEADYLFPLPGDAAFQD